MKGNVQTKASALRKSVSGTTVIHFHDRPLYRDHELIVSSRVALELFEIKRYRGELRAKVNSVTHAPKKCHVVIEGKNFSVRVGFTGQVSAGVEEA